MRRFISLAAVVALLQIACSGSPTGSDVDVLTDVVGVDVVTDVVADVVGDGLIDVGDVDEPFDPSAFCAPADLSGGCAGLLPCPWRVLSWGDGSFSNVSPATSFMVEAEPQDEAGLSALNRVAGLTRVSDAASAGLVVTIHSPAEWAAVTAACASDIPQSDEAYIVRWSAVADEKHRLDIFAPTAAGRLWAWKTVKQVLSTVEIPSPELLVVDAPASKFRGVVETFYGSPYKEADRLALLPHLADMKYNMYIYAAKMDPYTNWIAAYWSEEWPVEYTDMMETLATAIKAEGMMPGVQLRIDSLSLIMSSSVDMEKFLVKIRLFYDLGFRLFSLSFDDVQKVMGPEDTLEYATFDEGTIDFSKRAFEAIHQEMPDMILGWVPADYFTNAVDAPVSLPIAGMQIPAYVSIGWTGTEIMPATITSDDADAVGVWLKRKPLLGDNYPVLEHTGARVFLGPLEGRANDLADHLDGIMFNPMPFPFASLPGLATCADYAWNSVAYRPEGSMENMAYYLGGRGMAAGALAIMADVNRSPTLAGTMAPDLTVLIEALWADVEAGGPIDVSFLRENWFIPFGGIPDAWADTTVPGPSDELRSALQKWADQLGRYGDAGVLALDIIEAVQNEETPAPATVAEFQTILQECRTNEKRPTGDIMQDFLDRVETDFVPE
jgi:hyaluronoglucosaminidase